jgi:hypothetical protein
MEEFRLVEVLYDNCVGHHAGGSRGIGAGLSPSLYSKSHS